MGETPGSSETWSKNSDSDCTLACALGAAEGGRGGAEETSTPTAIAGIAIGGLGRDTSGRRNRIEIGIWMGVVGEARDAIALTTRRWSAALRREITTPPTRV